MTTMSRCLGAVKVITMVLLLSSTMSGCATMGMHLRYGSMESTTEMSESVFLDLTNELPRTVYVSETNTMSTNVSIEAEMRISLESAGYTIVETPAQATYIVQVSHRQLVGRELTDGQTLKDAIGSAFAAGGVAAYATGLLTDSDAFGPVGLGVGLLAFLLDSQTKHMAHFLTTDVRVTENRCGPGGSDTREHTTQVVAGASKVNLSRDAAMPVLIAGVTQAVTGLLPKS